MTMNTHAHARSAMIIATNNMLKEQQKLRDDNPHYRVQVAAMIMTYWMVGCAITFMNLFDPSSWAALALGPNTLQEHHLRVSDMLQPTSMPRAVSRPKHAWKPAYCRGTCHNNLMSAASSASARPSTSGCSGPTATRPILFFWHQSLTCTATSASCQT